MGLRNHRLVFCDGVPSWPPIWRWRGGEDNRQTLGEVGVLKEVIPCRFKPSNRCYLIIDYQGTRL